MKKLLSATLAVSMLFGAGQLFADDVVVEEVPVVVQEVPVDSIPLSQIIKKLEDQGFSNITDIEYEDGNWEVEATKNSKRRQLKVDRMSGAVLSDLPED